MIDQIFSWGTFLSLIGVIGFHFAGENKWWAWYINIANQILWFTYAIVTEQYGFFIGAIFFSVVFVRNAIKWTKKHRAWKQFQGALPSQLLMDMTFDSSQFVREAEASQQAIDKLQSGLSASEIYQQTKDLLDSSKLQRRDDDLKDIAKDRLEEGTASSDEVRDIFRSDNVISRSEAAKLVGSHPSGFKVGDVVRRKNGSYNFVSTVRVIFRNGAGVWNLVCEHSHDRGLLHIFAASMMEKVEP